MKKCLFLILAIVLLFCFGGNVRAESPFNYQVHKLYSAPDENSNVVLNIPVETTLLDISEDGNWYKVKLSYSLGPLVYSYSGWARIPISNLLFAADSAAYSFSLPIEKIYAAPDENSRLVYQIPIEIKILALSENGNWYKVKVAYSVGPFGYTYIGWANVPVGDIYLAREAATCE